MKDNKNFKGSNSKEISKINDQKNLLLVVIDLILTLSLRFLCFSILKIKKFKMSSYYFHQKNISH